MRSAGTPAVDDRQNVIDIRNAVAVDIALAVAAAVVGEHLQDIVDFDHTVTIEIGGHTDSKGSNRYNQKLSQQRVEAVRSYLVNKGVDPSRMTAVGYGEEMPIDTNRTAEGRANNRRVEFIRTDNECKK